MTKRNYWSASKSDVKKTVLSYWAGNRRHSVDYFQYSDLNSSYGYSLNVASNRYYVAASTKCTDIYDPSTVAGVQYVDKYNSMGKIWKYWHILSWALKAKLVLPNTQPYVANDQWRICKWSYYSTTATATQLDAQLSLVTATLSIDDALRCIPTMRLSFKTIKSGGSTAVSYSWSSKGTPYWFTASKRDFTLDLSSVGGLTIRGDYGVAASPVNTIYHHHGFIWVDALTSAPTGNVGVVETVMFKVKSWDPIVKLYNTV